MTCDNKTFLKSIQFSFCVVVLVYKIWTIWEEHRVTLLLQKKSMEWSWSSYTAAGDPVSLLSDITFGSYVIISGAFLLGRILGDHTTKAESILLVVGFLLYFITGGILINCVDDVPHKLVVNTLVLGVLAIVTGVLFLFDAGIKGRTKKKHKEDQKVAKLEKDNNKKKEMIVVLPSTSDDGQKKAEPQREIMQSEYAEAIKPSDMVKPGREKGKESGIHSVEIRIKEPERDFKEKERSRAVRGLDVVEGLGHRRDSDDFPKYQLYQSKRDDDYLRQTPKLVLPELEVEPVAYLSRERNPKYFPSLKTTPVRHTSSYYVSNPHSPFAWKRLEEHS